MHTARVRRRGWMLSAVLVMAMVMAAVAVVAMPAARADDPTVRRLAGPNRFATAAAVAGEFAAGVDRAFLATGRDFPDALAAVPAAARADAPILLVTGNRIPDVTADALDRLDPGAITIVGGTSVISGNVARAAGNHTDGPVDRVAGADRHATAAAVADRFFDAPVDVAYVATSQAFADAVAGGPAAAHLGGPLLLTRQDRLPQVTGDALDRLQPGRIVVLGGPAAVSDDVEEALADHTDGAVERHAGRHRYATAATVVDRAIDAPRQRVYMATGADFPDALVGGALAGRDDTAVVTVPHDCVRMQVLEQVDRLAPDELVVLGGEAAVAPPAAALQPCEQLPPGVRVTTVEEDLDVPWDIVFTPDDRTFLTERDTGRVLERRSDGSLREVISFPVDNGHEGGLLGLAVSPTYAVDGWLYALWVSADDQRVVRFRANGSGLQEVVTGLPDGSDTNVSHFAGRIDFGPDGMLYVAIGDVRDRWAAQDVKILSGKILRYTPAGDVPPDNPFGNPVWAYGLRDPQGLAWDADGRMYASEFGPDRDDEINLVERAGNYGWPRYTGEDGGDDRYVDPIVVRQPPEASWSGISVLDGGAIPEWEGDLFVAALRGTRLWRVDLEDGEVVDVESLLQGTWGRFRHVVPAPDGSLWAITSNHDDNGDPVTGDDRIIRIGP